jgi:hypothetical protein
MATDAGSERATAGIFVTGQGLGAVGDPAAAMTAPGSSPAAHDISPDGAPEVEPNHYTGRHLHTRVPDGEGDGPGEGWSWQAAHDQRWGP